ncbi:hypothetical protein BPAE_0015g00010 [Botrytis paeoniae]|uniref:Uncharacterized protein n=1 Tax=Botrytis paeoniae TaxID=278948 RepID=A0A4Z1G5M5_9HELO|nr:hypothetical protein BPAE_0015g00010 [Botrytis paeoniae]
MPASNQTSSTGKNSSSNSSSTTAPRKASKRKKTGYTGQAQKNTSDTTTQILRGPLRASPEPMDRKYQAGEASTKKPQYSSL